MSLSFGTVWIEMATEIKRVSGPYVSLSFGTVWIEIFHSQCKVSYCWSLSFGTVWIEIQGHGWNVRDAVVTVLRDGVD